MISGEPSDFPEMTLNNKFVLNRWPAFARARLFEHVIEFFEQISDVVTSGTNENSVYPLIDYQVNYPCEHHHYSGSIVTS